MDLLTTFAQALWAILTEAGWWLVAGFGVAGLLHALVPRSLLSRQLGGTGRRGRFWSVLKGALIGAPLPLCSCSVIPAAAALRRGGAGRGASAAFAVATPEVDAPSMAVTWGMMGPVMALARPISALATAITAGLLVDAAGEGTPRRTRFKDATPKSQSNPQPPSPPKSCCGTSPAPTISLTLSTPSCCGNTPTQASTPPAPSCCASSEPGDASSDAPPTLSSRLTTALRYGYLDLPRMLAGWIFIGLLVSALVAAALPTGWIESNLGSDSPLGAVAQKLLMLVIGVPLYVCATASTPLAAALVAKGLTPGAALVFLLAGPATNPATMGWALKDLGVRGLAAYLASIATIALAAGFIVDLALPKPWLDTIVTLSAASVGEHHHASTGAFLGGIVLTAILALGLLRRFVPGKRAATQTHNEVAPA